MKKSISPVIIKILGLLFSLSAGFYFVILLMENLSRIPEISWDMFTILTILLSIVLFVSSIGINGIIWKLLLQDQGVAISGRDAQAIILIAQFGKYLPGNVGHHVGRIYLANKAKIPLFATVNTMLQETLWSVGVGAGLSALALSYFVSARSVEKVVELNPLLLSLFFLGALLLPWGAAKTINRFVPELGRKLSKSDKLPEPKWITAIYVSLLYLVCFFIMAGVLNLQAQQIFGQSSTNILHLTGIFAIVWVAGYLVPGAPAGLGIREAMLVLFLSPLFGVGAALGVSVTLRITTTLGDGFAFALGIILKRVGR